MSSHYGITGSHTAVRIHSHCATEAGTLRHLHHRSAARRRRRFGMPAATLRRAVCDDVVLTTNYTNDTKSQYLPFLQPRMTRISRIRVIGEIRGLSS